MPTLSGESPGGAERPIVTESPWERKIADPLFREIIAAAQQKCGRELNADEVQALSREYEFEKTLLLILDASSEEVMLDELFGKDGEAGL